MAALHATRGLIGAIRLDVARSTLVLALLDARRTAYLFETTVDVRLPIGATEAVVSVPSRVFVRTALPPGTYVLSSNRREGVRFHPSGLADNATFSLADRTTARRVEVVVNQRGGIH